MENDDNKAGGTTEQGNEQLAREEILANSREENKTGDERERNLYGKGLQIAYSVGLLVMCVVNIVNTIVLDRPPVELWIVYMSMTATSGLYYAIKVGKRRPLFLTCGIIGGIGCVFCTVVWILELCGAAL